MKSILTAGLIGSVLLASMSAMALGLVKIECMNNCASVNLGQACDTYSTGSLPVALSCDDTAVGSGSTIACGTGSATCRPWGSVLRSDPVSAYCQDGSGYDAIVTCN